MHRCCVSVCKALECKLLVKLHPFQKPGTCWHSELEVAVEFQ